ncbi:MAG: STAS domain-containing protein [Betaproteobacteria bacterium]
MAKPGIELNPNGSYQRMALFSKPPPKKPEALKLEPKAAAPMISRAQPHAAERPVSARELAVVAQGRKRNAERQNPEPAGDISVTGASLVQWTPTNLSIEVAQTNPGLCGVLENAALLFAGGQKEPAREMLEQGVQTDPEARVSALAWLALFDVLQRVNAKVAFEKVALQYVVQFERSAPAWEEGLTTTAGPKLVAGGFIPVTGKLSAASLPQVEGLKRAIEKKVPHARLDLASVTGFDDAGARLLADALAHARKHRFALTLQRPDKLRTAVDAVVKRGRDGGEGTWLLSLELLQFQFDQDAFDNRAIEYAVAFEQSPPSWEPPSKPEVAPIAPEAGANGQGPEDAQGAPFDAGVEKLLMSGVLAGSSNAQVRNLADFALRRPVVPIDMSAVDRIDFVCAGALLNAINRVESQRKAVQIVGASPIIRALLLLIGISPRHFLKKAD